MSKLIAIAVCAIACISFSGGFLVNDAVSHSSDVSTPEPVDGCIEKLIWKFKHGTSCVFQTVGTCTLAGDPDYPQATIMISYRGSTSFYTETSKLFSNKTILSMGYDGGTLHSAMIDCPHGRHTLEVITDLQPYL